MPIRLFSLFATILAAGLLLPIWGESIVFPEMGKVINLKTAYGAVGDGITDDTAAIQKAIDENKGSNKTLYFPNGTYLVSDSVGIFKGTAHSKDRFLTFQGQSETGTVIKLAEASAGFGDPKKPKIVVCVYQGESTGDVMHSYVRNLTIAVGAKNPGAVGLRFLSNNTGAIEHVTLRSLDPQHLGAIGLDMTQSQNGPCLVKQVTIDGFDRGVLTGNSFTLVFEHITVTNQRVVGFDNVTARTTLRDLRSTNSVPALRIGEHGQMTLIEADLQGGAADATAILVETKTNRTFVRDVTVGGYGKTLQPRQGEALTGPLREWADGTLYGPLAEQPPATLRLPIEETPEIPWETDLAKWIVFSAPKGEDITTALQTAIDDGVSAGKTTLCLLSNKNIISGPIRVHGSINRIVGMSGIVDVTDPNGVFKDGAAAVFTFDALTSPAIVVERFFLLGGWECPTYAVMFANASKATIVIKNVNMRGQTKTPNPGGRWFFEDFSPSRQATLRAAAGEKIWARQFNPESPKADMIDIDGGTLWMLGLKTEGRATHAIARNKAQVEILGGSSYQSWKKQELDPPMFRIIDATASFTLGIYHSVGFSEPFTTIVEEKQGDETKILLRKELDTDHLHLYRSK